jgi:transcriptional regulator of acetoin/glycerol metabolism
MSHHADASRFQYLPDRIWRARHAYFDEKRLPEDLVDPLLLNSWQRCERHGRSHAEHVVFDPVERHARTLLLERHRELLLHAAPELDALAQALSDAGYAVLMTDAQGQVIAVAGQLDRRSSPVQQAFRIGVNVSEAAIGTSAMSLAIAEQRLSRVLGPEHFFADNQLFHCCAAPVFGPDGALVATVDITRDTPGLDTGAVLLTKACARQIEQRLFDTQGAFVKLALDLGELGGTARIAFDADGRWVASSSCARQLIAQAPHAHDLQFEQVFEGSFNELVSSARKGTGQVLLRLRGGIRLRGELLDGSAASSVRSAAVREAPGIAAVQGRAVAKLPVDVRRAVLALDAGIPVLITGPTGAGKEVTARAVHDHTQRAQGPFLPINCGALPAELIAAELFGYAPGAFTGAKRGGSIGKIEAANHGTVLLDEIGDMPLDLQAALLRVLDTGEVLPVGAHRAVRADVRFICATHRDLRERVLAGRFREDLYYRLAGCIVNVPALRGRPDFDAVIDSVCGQLGVDPARLDAPLRRELAARPWPGNVRQLKHAIGLAAALTAAQAPLRLEDFPSTDLLASEAANDQPPSGEPVDKPVRTLELTQQHAIAEAMAQTQGNVTAAATLLGIGRATLYRKLGKLAKH